MEGRMYAASIPRAGTVCLALSANQLKVIAVVAMVFDHCILCFFSHTSPAYLLLRMPGRIAAPIMCLMVAEGQYYTSDLWRYMGRMFGMAVLSHLPFTLCFGYDPWRFWQATDVIWALLMGLVALTAWRSPRLSLWRRVGMVLLCCLLAYSADWNYIAVLMVLLFGIFRGDHARQTAALIAVGCLYVLQAVWYSQSPLMRFGVFFAIPLLWCYGGQLGKKSRAIQWGSYWSYPVHLLVLLAISQLV